MKNIIIYSSATKEGVNISAHSIFKASSDKKYNQHYDHIFHIINRLNGDKPLSMTPEMEEKLRYLFLQIQEPFEKYCPEDRKNFISYNFVFYKFCEMLGYYEFLRYFPLLKSKDKLYDQEKIWQKIMGDIGWDTPSTHNRRLKKKRKGRR